MLDNPQIFNFGLCHWNLMLFGKGIITEDEYNITREYIRDNRPQMFQRNYSYKNRDNTYYWNADNIKPRIKWLKYHINKLK